MVELSVYNGIPHLLGPVVTDVEQAAKILFWAVKEMERRYQLCSQANARDLERYNAYLTKRNEKPLPYIVIIVDEMADLMMAAPEEVEKHICRLAQMARAVGIHLIIATQRPSVNVITGLIKANFPARIAFAVSSQIDSRVILDMNGAERLLGKGDMLFMRSDASKVDRLQGTFLDDEEINRVVRYWKGFRTLETPKTIAPSVAGSALASPDDLDDADVEDEATPSAALKQAGTLLHSSNHLPDDRYDQPDLFGADILTEAEELKTKAGRDELFDEAVRIVEEAGRGSVSLLQRKLRIGYSRSSRLVDQLEEAGVLGPDMGGSQGRQVLTKRQVNQPEPTTDRPLAASTGISTGASAGTSPGTARDAPKPRIIGGEPDTNDDPRPRVWM
jgi:DNA segregation ATPase FtsK/SpoIIIE, S-DNA-T family